MTKQPLTFEQWYAINEQELDCIYAETGADRELDFDREADEEDRYCEYLDTTLLV
jgi:hypothetical protein